MFDQYRPSYRSEANRAAYHDAIRTLAACTSAPYQDVYLAFGRQCSSSGKPWREVYESVLAQSARGDYAWLTEYTKG